MIGIVLGIAMVVVMLAAIAIAIVIGLRRRCPSCKRRTLASEGGGVRPDGRYYKRLRCVHCKSVFAHIDGGYVPIEGTVAVPEAKATIHDRD